MECVAQDCERMVLALVLAPEQQVSTPFHSPLPHTKKKRIMKGSKDKIRQHQCCSILFSGAELLSPLAYRELLPSPWWAATSALLRDGERE